MKPSDLTKHKPLALSLQSIAALIGEEKALRLSKYIKHRHIYIKKRFSPDDKLTRIIGRPGLFILYNNYAGELIHITPQHGYVTEAVRLLKQGLSVQAIARRFHVAPTRIASIAKSRRITLASGAGQAEAPPGGIGSSGTPPCGGKGSRSVRVVSGKNEQAEKQP